MLEFGLCPSPLPLPLPPSKSPPEIAAPSPSHGNLLGTDSTPPPPLRAARPLHPPSAQGFGLHRQFFCVWLGLPHGGSCGSRPGFLLPSSPASPRSSWASLLLKGLSRRALDLEAGLAENGGVGGVLGPTMGVRDFEVAPLFTMQTRFCSKP